MQDLANDLFLVSSSTIACYLLHHRVLAFREIVPSNKRFNPCSVALALSLLRIHVHVFSLPPLVSFIIVLSPSFRYSLCRSSLFRSTRKLFIPFCSIVSCSLSFSRLIRRAPFLPSFFLAFLLVYLFLLRTCFFFRSSYAIKLNH